MRRAAVLLALVGSLVACSDDGSTSSPSLDADSVAATDTPGTGTGTALPAQCTPPPYTVVAQRDGERPAGSATFEVVGAAALPIPLVPDTDDTLTPSQVAELGATTPLLAYILFFGDEPFGPDDVSTFGGYEPEGVGKSRGNIGLFPHTTTPLAVGDVVVGGSLDELGLQTTFHRIGLDFKAAPDELTGYLDEVQGSITILALDDDYLCIDVDLTWDYSDFSSSADGVLTVQGIFTAPLADRSLPFT